MVGEEVTIAGFAESVRGRGGICFVTLGMALGRSSLSEEGLTG